MPDKFQNKYRIPSARLKNWDYASNGAYFITICTKNRRHYFGEIINGMMELSPIGVLAQDYWNEIPKHFPFAGLGNFVVMPDHFHGILILDTISGDAANAANAIADADLESNADPSSHANSSSHADPAQQAVQTLQCNVCTIRIDNNTDPEKMASISPKSGSVSTIIRSYKSAVTKNAHFIDKQFAWHPRFYDHIIRNAASFERIQAYIANNPEKWAKDTSLNRK